ncbi:hypothetical protein ACTQ3J_06460 [Oscillospiraceae bacterium LCP25S3_E3]
MYGKIIDNRLQIAPNPVVMDDKTIANPSGDILTQLGYLPVVTKNEPAFADGYYYKSVYTENEGKIYQDWEKHKLEEENDEITQIKKQVSKNTNDITATQEALCELYETVV